MITGVYYDNRLGEKEYTVLWFNKIYGDRGAIWGHVPESENLEVGDLILMNDCAVLQRNPPRFDIVPETTFERIGNAREVFGDEIIPVLKHELRLSLFYGLGEYDYQWHTLLPVDPEIRVAGDACTDRELDILDVIATSKFFIGLKTLNEEQIVAGDMNWDGTFDTTDANLILKEVLSFSEIG